MATSEIERFYPETREEWRKWLTENHIKKDAIWLILYKKKAAKPTISWSDAVDEALCFGWIDSIKRKLNDESSVQYFSKRKAQSTWSKINKQKVEKLKEAGKMNEAGLACIELAKQNGSWTILDDVEELIIPKDLEVELRAKSDAMDFFLSLGKSVRKAMLQWLVLAKRLETRQNRISIIVEHAEKGLKPPQF